MRERYLVKKCVLARRGRTGEDRDFLGTCLILLDQARYGV
jgi:hypothetical protein